MSFEVTKPLLDSIRTGVSEGRDSAVEALLSELHPADIAAIMDRLDLDDSVYVYRLLVHDKIIQPLPEDQVGEKSMRHKLAMWYSKQLPKDHPLLG